MVAEQGLSQIIEAHIAQVGGQLIDDSGQGFQSHCASWHRHPLSGGAQRTSQVAEVAGLYNSPMGIAGYLFISEQIMVFIATPVRQLCPTEISSTLTEFGEQRTQSSLGDVQVL